MVTLPANNHLPVQRLASSFDNVTNSYKFYWFLAILEHIQEHYSRKIPTDKLLARMIAGVWYPTNYFRLSFGKQDQLGIAAIALGMSANLPMDARKKQILDTTDCLLRENSGTARNIQNLGKYVPYRFLRPFFDAELRAINDWEINRRIKDLADIGFQSPESPCLYRFVGDDIEIHPIWFEYLQQHLAILSGFTLWNLVKYLQKNNPNVANISSKLFEPQHRDLKLARRFWNHVFDHIDELPCIYSGQAMRKQDFSLDHFLPWRFVTHDLLWNLLPAPKSVNSSKSDNLPDPTYFDRFADLQYQAVQSVLPTIQAPKLLEDYVMLFKASAISDLQGMDFARFRDSLHAVIAPQLQIAANMGFPTGWKYTP